MKLVKKSLPSNQKQAIPLVFFAQVPPPEHGQSRMVRLALEALREHPDCYDIHHINARFSETLEDVGESSPRKAVLIVGFLVQAIFLRIQLSAPILYYVPGPAKWSAVFRDWFVLGVLRIFYRKVIFHWHAIGQGEWANGCERVTLLGPRWINRCARAVSRWVLNEPFASISVSETSGKDAATVGSLHSLVVNNGIADPVPHFLEKLGNQRREAFENLSKSECPVFKILFLSHGTREKGLFEALDAVAALLRRGGELWSYELTFAGGVRGDFLAEFEKAIEDLKCFGKDRLKLTILGYLGEAEKNKAYREHDIFLSASRWESFGLTTVEAMAHGMQIVATASDGVRGVLPSCYPYLATPGNSEAYAEILLQCCRDLRQAEGESKGFELRERFVENFRLASFSLNFKKALDHLCQASIGGLVAKTRAVGGGDRKLPVSVYLADQNPGYDRSFGISRMSVMVLKALVENGSVRLNTIVSQSSQRIAKELATSIILPWGTRWKGARFLTDHLHPMLKLGRERGAVNYYPKGYLPFLSFFCSPSVVTIHDTIIQYDEDHYPKWRSQLEYSYWAKVLKHTLQRADRVLTVSQSSKEQIQNFMRRHKIPEKEVTVTYEPCAYHDIPQVSAPKKDNYVLHLASVEPHKGTAGLVTQWSEAEAEGRRLPTLHLVGSIPEEVRELVKESRLIKKRPFLSDDELKEAYLGARALILPSEIEGFGLPALEAYYLGTPVCFVRETSVEEILSVATCKGGMMLDHPCSLFEALEEVLAMDADEIRNCGLKLREVYSPERVAARMLVVFEELSRKYS